MYSFPRILNCLPNQNLFPDQNFITQKIDVPHFHTPQINNDAINEIPIRCLQNRRISTNNSFIMLVFYEWYL